MRYANCGKAFPGTDVTHYFDLSPKVAHKIVSPCFARYDPLFAIKSRSLIPRWPVMSSRVAKTSSGQTGPRSATMDQLAARHASVGNYLRNFCPTQT
jgi:hypothetical protein